ncbi:MAG: SIR2 family protein [Thermodesulfobacteriota bacterium]
MIEQEEKKEANQRVREKWDNKFLLGCRDLLAEIMGDKPTNDQIKNWNEQNFNNVNNKWNEFLLQSQIYISKLLKAENLSFLLGAGPSIPLGAITIKNIPLKLEFQIQQSLANGSKEIELFYKILEHLIGARPFKQKNLQERFSQIDGLLKGEKTNQISEEEIKIPLEELLSFLYCLRSALDTPFNRSNGKSALSFKRGSKEIRVRLSILDRLITAIKKEYFHLLAKVPYAGIMEPLIIHKQFLKKILTRPLNLRRPKIFTTNYDTLIEKSMDELGIMYLDGFIGSTQRSFRPECYNFDFYFPSTSTEGKVHRVDQVIHFYKIHGSINWVRNFYSSGNIYGIETQDVKTIEREKKYGDVMIYPTPLKNEFTLDFPYSDLFRRFSDGITQPQSVLITIGYSFADEHVNRIIYQALTIPSFTLLVVDPAADKNNEIEKLITLEDSRIYIISGWELATFESFTRKLLPDIKELEVYEKSAKSASRMLRLPDNSSLENDEE